MSNHQALTIHTDAEQSVDMVRLTLTVDLPPGVHIEPNQPSEPYLIPTVLEVDGLSDVTVDYPTPTVKDLGWRDVTLTVLEGTFQFVVTGRVRTGVEWISGTLHYQPCVGGACLPPRTTRWQSPVSGTTAYSVLRALAAQPGPDPASRPSSRSGRRTAGAGSDCIQVLSMRCGAALPADRPERAANGKASSSAALSGSAVGSAH